jgi:putative MFS transporter
MQEAPTASRAILYLYSGFVIGDLSSGLLSQLLKSRRKVLLLFICLAALFSGIFLNLHEASLQIFYISCFTLGFSGGYWAVFVTNAAEQFGTNLRATVTTTAPNFVRGSTVLVTHLFLYLNAPLGIIHSAMAVGALCVLIALFALSRIDETFGRDLDFVEEG